MTDLELQLEELANAVPHRCHININDMSIQYLCHEEEIMEVKSKLVDYAKEEFNWDTEAGEVCTQTVTNGKKRIQVCKAKLHFKQLLPIIWERFEQ